MTGKRILIVTALLAVIIFGYFAARGDILLPDIFGPAASPTPEPTPEMVVLACGAFDASSHTLTLRLEEGEVAELSRFTELKYIDLTGSAGCEEILEYIDAHPEVAVRYGITLPSGAVIGRNTTSADLSGVTHSDIDAYIEQLTMLTDLEYIDLGTRGDGVDELMWADVGAVQQTFPNATVYYRFTLFGKELTILDEQLVLSHRAMDDNGEAVREVLPYMTKCTFLDMDSCGVDNEHMAQIRDDFPDMKVVWRVWFGGSYTCRTDVTRLLASSEGGRLDDDTSEGLYYCTDVIYMDIGHSQLMDLSFLYNMPNIEVLIVACAPWRDATPIGSLEKLEYLEVLSTSCDDITPFANLHNLKHLNMGNCWLICDITPLYELTQLERLWIGCMTPVPAEQKQEIIELLPDTVINITTPNHKGEGWCTVYAQYVPRYKELREQFGNYQRSAYAYASSDILYFKSIDELTEDEKLLIKP